MRIPLIVSSRAQEGVKYPSVVLRPGIWKFEHNAETSQFRILVSDTYVEPHEELELTSHADVSVQFICAGTEPSITVFACLSA